MNASKASPFTRVIYSIRSEEETLPRKDRPPQTSLVSSAYAEVTARRIQVSHDQSERWASNFESFFFLVFSFRKSIPGWRRALLENDQRRRVSSGKAF